MVTRAKPTAWTPAMHPTLTGYYCLARVNAQGERELLGNRLSDRPPVEAFVNIVQAARVAAILADKKESAIE
jgi:hypothetical protein